MSIQPVTIGPPLPPPPQAARPAGSATPPPASSSGTGALVVLPGGEASQTGRSDAGRAASAAQAGSNAANAAGNTRASERAEDTQGARERRGDGDSETLRDSVERAREAVEAKVRDIAFSVDDRTGDLVVRIIDRASKEVIRQIPAEEMLRIAERLENTTGSTEPGLLLKQEV